MNGKQQSISFSSMEDFMSRSEFFPKGRIIPQRILKGPRKLKHMFKFLYDSHALRTEAGYIILIDNSSECYENRCTLSSTLNNGLPKHKRVGKNTVVVMKGSAYTPGGQSLWLFKYKTIPSSDLSGKQVVQTYDEMVECINSLQSKFFRTHITNLE